MSLAQRAHAQSLLDQARGIHASLDRLPASRECVKAQQAAAVLARSLEELVEVLR
jgi:hypothetical protein